MKCDVCGREVPQEELVEYGGEYYCEECADKHLTKCERCGEIVSYEDAHGCYDGHLCECCYDDLF